MKAITDTGFLVVFEIGRINIMIGRCGSLKR